MNLAGRPWRGVSLVVVAGAVIALDQWAKSWAQRRFSPAGVPHHILGPANFVLTYNSGAAFSLGSGASSVMEAVAVALVVAVLWFSGRLARTGANPATIIGFGLVSGGALSNLVDRFFRHHHGAVVDFIQLVSWWPIFNVADAAITLGAITIAITLVFSSVPKPTHPAVEPRETPGQPDMGVPGLAGAGPADASPRHQAEPPAGVP